MAKDARDHVWLECTECGTRKYRTQKRVKGVQTKLNLRKFCNEPVCRRHYLHIERKK